MLAKMRGNCMIEKGLRLVLATPSDSQEGD